MNEPALLELRRLAGLVAEVVEDAQHTQRRLLAADDRRVGAVLLPLAAALVGDARVSGPMLYTLALNDRTPTGKAAREVITEYGSLRALGKLLARIAGTVLGGHRLVPAGSIAGDRAYTVEPVSCD